MSWPPKEDDLKPSRDNDYIPYLPQKRQSESVDSLRRRANARNVSFRISLRWPIHNQFLKPKYQGTRKPSRPSGQSNAKGVQVHCRSDGGR